MTFQVSWRNKAHPDLRYCGADTLPMLPLLYRPSRKLPKALPMVVPPGMTPPYSGCAVCAVLNPRAGLKPTADQLVNASIFHSPPVL